MLLSMGVTGVAAKCACAKQRHIVDVSLGALL